MPLNHLVCARCRDENGDGLISRREFHKATLMLGLRASRAAIDRLFDEFDKDGGGTIEYKELHKMLRRRLDDAGLKKARAARRKTPLWAPKVVAS